MIKCYGYVCTHKLGWFFWLIWPVKSISSGVAGGKNLKFSFWLTWLLFWPLWLFLVEFNFLTLDLASLVNQNNHNSLSIWSSLCVIFSSYLTLVENYVTEAHICIANTGINFYLELFSFKLLYRLWQHLFGNRKKYSSFLFPNGVLHYKSISSCICYCCNSNNSHILLWQS